MRLYLIFHLIVLTSFIFSNDQLIDELYLDMTQNSTPSSIALEEGEHYYLVVSGTYCVGSCWGGNFWDAAYNANHPYSDADDPSIPVPMNGHWDWNGNISMRPTPDGFNSEHIYYYPFISNGGSEVFHFQDDGGYGDNSGGLTIQIWKQENTDNDYDQSNQCSDQLACN